MRQQNHSMLKSRHSEHSLEESEIRHFFYTDLLSYMHKMKIPQVFTLIHLWRKDGHIYENTQTKMKLFSENESNAGITGEYCNIRVMSFFYSNFWKTPSHLLYFQDNSHLLIVSLKKVPCFACPLFVSYLRSNTHRQTLYINSLNHFILSKQHFLA